MGLVDVLIARMRTGAVLNLSSLMIRGGVGIGHAFVKWAKQSHQLFACIVDEPSQFVTQFCTRHDAINHACFEEKF